jgi:hypothetical protein
MAVNSGQVAADPETSKRVPGFETPSRDLRRGPGIYGRSGDIEARSLDLERRRGIDDEIQRSAVDLEISRQCLGIWDAVARSMTMSRDLRQIWGR